MHFDYEIIKRVAPEAQLAHGTLGHDITFSIDSRSIKSSELFFALEGEKTDGHLFITEALRNGAGIVIAQDKEHMLLKIPADLLHSKIVLMVPNPLTFMLDLARAWRARFTYPVIGITGSIGKTSTKDTLVSIFQAAEKKYIASHANQNTLLGIALTISRMRSDLDFAVFEVGINKAGEMLPMAQLLQPTTGIITYIAHTHTEGLGNLAAISAEKRLLFSCFKETSIGIINGDLPFLSNISYAHPVIRFGLKITHQIQARQIKHHGDSVSFNLKIYGEKYPLTLSPDHTGRINSALACIALCHYLEIPLQKIIDGIQHYEPAQHRFKQCPLKDYKGIVIDDAYNASPESVKAALVAFDGLPHTGKKIAILGDMLELGPTSAFWHRQLGRFFKKTPTVNHVIFVGKETEAAVKLVPGHVTVTHVPQWTDAIPAVRATLEDNVAVLIKGSQGTNLRNVVKELVQE